MNLNIVTAAALLAWPLVAVWLYKTFPLRKATLWTFLGAYMFLPVGAEFKIPMVPAFDKNSIPAWVALAACTLLLGRRIKMWRGFGLPEILIFVLMVSPFVTSSLNGDPIVIGTRVLEGIDAYEAGSVVISQFISLIPFFIGRQILNEEDAPEDILRVLIVAGLIYSVPMLAEVRLSPQLHAWVYGYFPHMFSQAFRDGGFRPVVFMGHGLLVAFFIMTSAVAAAAFWRTATPIFRFKLPGWSLTGYLSVLLLLAKTLGALAYGALLVPLVRFFSVKMHVRVAVVLVTVSITYPALRSFDLVPTEAMLQIANAFSEDRASSLDTRFRNEIELLERASQRFYFGWGRWGRSRVYDAGGTDITYADGTWIITLGQFGFIGFIAQFGLLCYPVFRIAGALRSAPTTRTTLLLSTVMLIVAINIVDLLPNSSLRPWTWLLAGALLGQAERLRTVARRQRWQPQGASVVRS